MKVDIPAEIVWQLRAADAWKRGESSRSAQELLCLLVRDYTRDYRKHRHLGRTLWEATFSPSYPQGAVVRAVAEIFDSPAARNAKGGAAEAE